MGGGEREPRVFCFFSPFLCFSLSFFESKLNLNSALPYADLHRNVPYAFKFAKQHQRQTLNEDFILSKYKERCQRPQRCTGSVTGEHSCRAVKKKKKFSLKCCGGQERING